MDAVELAAGDGEVAGVGGATGEADRVELVHQVAGVDVDADVDAGAEDDAFRLHLFEAAVDEALLHLELGDAVAEEAADAVVALEDGDVVAGAAELLGGGEASGPGADDGDAALGALLRRLGVDPALAPGALDDADLDLLDGDGVVVDAEDAGGLAGAGQRRPVNSGKLLVACRRSMASRQWPRYTRSFQSGMMLPRGQPWWQKGTPQSMQRAACSLSCFGGISS